MTLNKEILRFLWGNNIPPQFLRQNSTQQFNISTYQIPAQGKLVSRHLPGSQYATPTHPEGHTGIDIANSPGTPIYSIGPGYVSDVGVGQKGGNWVTTRHENGKMKAYYAHLNSIDVQKGQQVNNNTIVGRMGDTGNAKGRGAHLHLQVSINGTNINPLTLSGKAVNNRQATLNNLCEKYATESNQELEWTWADEIENQFNNSNKKYNYLKDVTQDVRELLNKYGILMEPFRKNGGEYEYGLSFGNRTILNATLVITRMPNEDIRIKFFPKDTYQRTISEPNIPEV